MSRLALPGIASIILDRIADDPPPPEGLGRLPAEHMIPRSGAWWPGDLMGIRGLGSGVSARYARGETRWTAFATDPKAVPATLDPAWSAA